MNRTAVVIAVLACISVVPAGVTAVENDPPLAEAGLDQRAEVGETVLLDGTGSRDPGGTIETYEWQIETPDGTRLTPADPSDPRTRFVVREPGRYDVTVTVTDGDGARSSDTLYVFVTGGVRFASTSGNSRASGPPATTSPSSTTTEPIARVPWFSNWAKPKSEENSYISIEEKGVTPTVPKQTSSDGGNNPATPTPTPKMKSIFELDTLELTGSDITYKEDIASKSYGVNERVGGFEMGDGEAPLNEIHEGVTGIYNGVKQVVVGTEEKTFTKMVSGDTARKMEDMADHSKGKFEDDINEKMNTREEAPAIKEDYILNDGRVLDGVTDSADRVEVEVHVPEQKGLVDHGENVVHSGFEMAEKSTTTVSSSVSNGLGKLLEARSDS